MKKDNNGRVHGVGMNREAIAKCLCDYMKKSKEKVGSNGTYVDVTIGNNNYNNSGRMRRKGGLM